jgi:hypothetical protein
MITQEGFKKLLAGFDSDRPNCLNEIYIIASYIDKFNTIINPHPNIIHHPGFTLFQGGAIQ